MLRCMVFGLSHGYSKTGSFFSDRDAKKHGVGHSHRYSKMESLFSVRDAKMHGIEAFLFQMLPWLVGGRLLKRKPKAGFPGTASCLQPQPHIPFR